MLIIGQEHSVHIKINVDQNVLASTFKVNREYLVIGQEKEVGVWRIKHGKQVAGMKMDYISKCSHSHLASSALSYTIGATKERRYLRCTHTLPSSPDPPTTLCIKHASGLLLTPKFLNSSGTVLLTMSYTYMSKRSLSWCWLAKMNSMWMWVGWKQLSSWSRGGVLVGGW